MLKRKIFGLMAGAAVLLGFMVAPSALAYTCPEGSLRGGGAVVSKPAECNIQKGDDGQTLINTVSTIINIILGCTGMIAVVMIIYGGIQYTISAGESGKVKKAKDTIMYGVVGLVIAILAVPIVNFVIDNVFKK